MKSLSVLIPAYNEEKLLKKSTLDLLYYLKSLKIDFEIIICINASKDKTEDIAEILSKKYKEIRYIVIRKKGFGLALRAGIKAAKKELITYMPADGEAGNDFIERALKEINNYDVILGSRYLIREYKLENLFREFLSRAYAKIIRLIFSSRVTEFGTIKMFKSGWAKRVVKECNSVKFEFQVEMLYFALRDKKRIKEIPVKVNYQGDRESKVNIVKDIALLAKSSIMYGIKLKIHQLFH